FGMRLLVSNWCGMIVHAQPSQAAQLVHEVQEVRSKLPHAAQEPQAAHEPHAPAQLQIRLQHARRCATLPLKRVASSEESTGSRSMKISSPTAKLVMI